MKNNSFNMNNDDNINVVLTMVFAPMHAVLYSVNVLSNEPSSTDYILWIIYLLVVDIFGDALCHCVL
jgi:hypothetical protein